MSMLKNPAGHLLANERAQRIELLVAVRADAYFLSATWTWSPCRKNGPAKPFAQRGGHHDGRVFVRALLGVADLGAGDLEDERAGVERFRGANHGTAGIVGHRADVDGRAR